MALEFDCSDGGLNDHNIACRHDRTGRRSNSWSRDHAIKKGFRTIKFHDIELNGLPHLAYHDNQSTVNVISRDFAHHHGLEFTKLTEDIHLVLADDSTAKAIGKVKVKCRLASYFGEVEFHVLKFTLFPVIVGRQLLAPAGLLNSQGITVGIDNPLRMKCRIRIKGNTGQENEAVAILHQGAHKNIMSLSYAQSNNHISPDHGTNDSGSSTPGARYATLGTRKIVESCNTTKAKLYRRSKVPFIRSSEMDIKFIIMENFPFDIALGNKLLESNKLPVMDVTAVAAPESLDGHAVFLPIRCFKQEENRHLRSNRQSGDPGEALHLRRPARSYT